MPSALTRARLVSDKPLDLDKHRGMAEQKATDIRRILADVENNAKDLRDRQGILENQLLSASAASWPLVWSHTLLFNRRVYGPEKISSPTQKDFCNTICQERTQARKQMGCYFIHRSVLASNVCGMLRERLGGFEIDGALKLGG
jgi:hypothetical protein